MFYSITSGIFKKVYVYNDKQKNSEAKYFTFGSPKLYFIIIEDDYAFYFFPQCILLSV